VAMISRLLKSIGLFCKRALQKRLYSAQETYDLKEPTNLSHPIDLGFTKLFVNLLSSIFGAQYYGATMV